MGKKRAPLRQPAKGNAKSVTSNSRSNLGKRSATALGSEPVKAPESKKANKKQTTALVNDPVKTPASKKENKKQIATPLILPPGDDDDEEDDEWSKIERDANGDDDDDEDDDDSDDDDDDDNSDYSDDDSDNEIKLQGNMDHVAEDYTFEFNDMRDEYTTGVRTLLRSVLSNPTEAYDLADLITAQKIVGTVINCEGGEDAFAFASVLPLQKCVEVPTMAKLMGHLAACLSGLPAKSLTPELKTMREIVASCTSSSSSTAGAGLLLHQRFSNLPIELIGPLHRNLEEDLSWAKQRNNIDGDGDSDDEDDKNKNKKGAASSSSSSSSSKSSDGKHPHFFATLAHVLLLCPVGGASLKEFDLSGSGGTRAHDVLGGSSLTFNSFEDEVYFQCAAAALLFKPPKSCNAAYEEGVVAVLVPAEKVKSCVNGICALLPDTV